MKCDEILLCTTGSFIYTSTLKSHVACKAFINVYANFLRVDTNQYMHAWNEKAEARTMLRDITQRHLKTFIEKYLNAIQVFNHSRLRLYLGQPIVNLCFQSSISEKREKTVSYRRVRSFALPLFSRTCVCTYTCMRKHMDHTNFVEFVILVVTRFRRFIGNIHKMRNFSKSKNNITRT